LGLGVGMMKGFLFVWGEGKQRSRALGALTKGDEMQRANRLARGWEGRRCTKFHGSIEGEEMENSTSSVRWSDLQLATKRGPLASSWRPPILFLGRRHLKAQLPLPRRGHQSKTDAGKRGACPAQRDMFADRKAWNPSLRFVTAGDSGPKGKY